MPKSSVESKPKPLNTAFFIVYKGYMDNIGKKAKYQNKPSRGNVSWTAAQLKLLCWYNCCHKPGFQSGNI